jgi:hypothetical protein
MKEALTNFLNTLGMAWWVEVVTENPRCTYYFGPFLGAKAAEAAKAGYVEDLEQEGAQGISTTVKQCKPAKLTIAADELGERVSPKMSQSFSGQI